MTSAFDEIRADEYSVASEAAQLGMLLINKVEEHAHLQAATVGYVFRDDELRRHGKVIAAECILVERILQADKRWSRLVKWALLRIMDQPELPDFLVLIDRNLWAGYGPEEKLALIDHEISHAKYETEDDGETPKLTKDGLYRWAIRGHDFEDFTGVIERNGLWRPELIAMARVVIDNLSRNAEAV